MIRTPPDIFKLVSVCIIAYLKICILRAGLFSVEISAGQCCNFQVLASPYYSFAAALHLISLLILLYLCDYEYT